MATLGMVEKVVVGRVSPAERPYPLSSIIRTIKWAVEGYPLPNHQFPAELSESWLQREAASSGCPGQPRERVAQALVARPADS